MSTKILITGAAGYIGRMLAEQFKEGPGVQIIALDIRNQPKALEHPKITWCIGDLRKGDWHNILGSVKPDIVIHTAWATKDNSLMTEHIFDYTLRNKVPKFIHLSSISGYGRTDMPAIENDPLRANSGKYGTEVIAAEMVIKKLYSGAGKTTETYILRLPVVFGPLAWKLEHFFGILGLLAHARLPAIISNRVRLDFQLIHEDDLIDIIGLLTFNKLSDAYDVFNLTPVDTVPLDGIAAVLGKRIIRMAPAIKNILPVAKRDLFEYSVIVDGRKFEKKFRYKYTYSSYEALTTDEGRYGK